MNGCAPDFEALRKEILDLHKATIEAHWDKDVNFLVRDVSEDYFVVLARELVAFPPGAFPLVSHRSFANHCFTDLDFSGFAFITPLCEKWM